MTQHTKLAVIDDDPTGAQAEADVPLLLEWSPAALAGHAGARAVHLLTNGRALDGAGAYAVVREAAGAAVAAMPERRVVLRGDSTLRGHLLAEFDALRDVLYPAGSPVLVLVPALPAAGRVTVGGVHWLERDGVRLPVANSEYARDQRFGYRSSRLLDWAQERSGGRFAAAAGRELALASLRAPGGSDALADALRSLAGAGAPAAFVPDAETVEDLSVIARGLRAAWDAGLELVVRCGPALVGVLAGTSATEFVAAPRAARGILVVIGSHVPTTTRQLAALAARFPEALIELDAAALAAQSGADSVIEEAAARALERLADGGVAIVATSRATPAELLAPAPGMRIARSLAAILARARAAADVVVSKGGITSAVNVREGFGAREAIVVGPLADGVALWLVEGAAVIVFPGNVGGDQALADLVSRCRGD